jgi:hypothetical protein
MKGGRIAGGTSNGDVEEGTGGGISLYTDHYKQSNINVQQARPMEGGRAARGISDRDEKEGIERGAF